MNDDRKNIHLSSILLDHSIDMLLDGVESLKNRRLATPFFNPDPEPKSALQSIITAIELLLKAKIVSLDWKEISDKPAFADFDKLVDGAAYTLNIKESFKKVQSLAGITFTTEVQSMLFKALNIRNNITHLHASCGKGQILAMIANSLGFYMDFYRNHVGKSFCEETDRTKYIDRQLKSYKEYVTIRIAGVRDSIKSMAKPITYHFNECPECLQNVFVLKNKNIAICSFCQLEQDIREITIEYSRFKEQIRPCSKCGCQSMAALHTSSNEEEAWQCIICGYFINYPQTWCLSDGEFSTDSIRAEFPDKENVALLNTNL